MATLAEDRPSVENELLDYWVPQLASNTPGVADNGEYWDEELIWQEHYRLKQQYDALLLNSNEYIYRVNGYWVSVAPTGYNSPEGALGWCQRKYLDKDHCFAKLITHNPSISDTVEYQN